MEFLIRSCKSQKIEPLSSIMYTEDLVRLGGKHVHHFKGVYALDELNSSHIQRFHPPPTRFIVNTHTKNLSGEHWLAVSYENDGIVYAFDPLGVYYPPRLSNFLKRLGRKVVFNTRTYQNPFLPTCGVHCLDWLRKQQQLHLER